MGAGASKNQVKIYPSCDFNGKVIKLPLGKFSLDMLKQQGYPIQSIRSLKIGPKTVVILYENPDLSGSLIKFENISATRTKEVKCLGDDTAEEWTNNVQSLIIQQYNEPGAIPEEAVTGETLDIKADKVNKLDLEGVHQKKIVVRDLDKPLKIKNIDGICVMKHILNSKDKLSEKDMANITKRCENTLEVIPQVSSPENVIESFGVNLINDRMLLFLIILGFILTYIYLQKGRLF